MTEGNEHVIDPNGDARRALLEAVSEHGPEALSDAAVMDTVCRDHLTGLPGESILIGDAARTNVPALLGELIPRLGNYGAIQSAAATLAGEHNLDMAASLWVVREFARALGYIAPGTATGTAASFPGSGPHPVPGSGPATGSGTAEGEEPRGTGAGGGLAGGGLAGGALAAGAAGAGAAAGSAASGAPARGAPGGPSAAGATMGRPAVGRPAVGGGTSGGAVSGGAVSGGAVSGGAVSGGAVSGGAVSGRAASGRAVPGEAASGAGVSGAAAGRGDAGNAGGVSEAGPGEAGPGATGTGTGGVAGTGAGGGATASGGTGPGDGEDGSGAAGGAAGGYAGGSLWGAAAGGSPADGAPEAEPGFPLPLPAGQLPGHRRQPSKVVNRNTVGIAAAIALVAGYLGVAAAAHLSPFPAKTPPTTPAQSSSSPPARTSSSPASSPDASAETSSPSQLDILLAKVPAAIRDQGNQSACKNAGTGFGATAVSQCQNLRGLAAQVIIYYLYPSRPALAAGFSDFLRAQKFHKIKECASSDGSFTDFLVDCQSDFTVKTPGVTGSIAEYTNSSAAQNPIIVSTDNEQNVMAVMVGTNDGDLLAYWNEQAWVVTS